MSGKRKTEDESLPFFWNSAKFDFLENLCCAIFVKFLNKIFTENNKLRNFLEKNLTKIF